MSKKKIKNDWIEDRDDDYVHRGELRSGWQEEHKSMTDYLLDEDVPRSAEGQIKTVYELCRNRGNNIAAGTPHNIIFSPNEDTGHTDGKKVFVSTKVMDEKKTFQEKTDILLGITTHELAHVIHTDFPLMKKEIKNKFVHQLWNIIEDERIEHAIGEETPGYADNLKAVKKYFFDEKYLLEEAIKGKKKLAPKTKEEEEKEKEKEEGKHLVAEEDPYEGLTEEASNAEVKAMELFDLVFKFIRYPEHIDADVAAAHETELDDIKKILTPYPKNPMEAIVASKGVAKVIRESLEEDEEIDPGEMKAIEEMISGMMESSGADSENEDPTAPGPREPSKEARKIDFNEEWIEDKQWKAVFRKLSPEVAEVARYKQLHAEVKGDANRLASVLFTKVYSERKTLKGMRTGSLDDNKIIEASRGVKTVHLQHIEKETKRLNMTVLIDESGSMADGVKDRDAAKVAILLEQAYRIFPVGQLFIYGFTSDDYATRDFNTIFRYKEPGIDTKFGLGCSHGRSNNRDGHCIRAVARRVRQFTQDPMLFFIISDGQPAGSRYNGYPAMMDTKQAVIEASKMKFFPIQIGIGGGITKEEQKIMFDDFVNYSTSRQMVDEIRKLLLKRAHKLMGI